MSTWRWPNLLLGWANFPKPVSVWRVTLDFWQGMQAVAHDLTSAVMESQIYLFLISFVAVFLDGWERPWIMSKTSFRSVGGTHAQGVPVLVSQMIVGPSGISILSNVSDV